MWYSRCPLLVYVQLTPKRAASFGTTLTGQNSGIHHRWKCATLAMVNRRCIKSASSQRQAGEKPRHKNQILWRTACHSATRQVQQYGKAWILRRSAVRASSVQSFRHGSSDCRKQLRREGSISLSQNRSAEIDNIAHTKRRYSTRQNIRHTGKLPQLRCERRSEWLTTQSSWLQQQLPYQFAICMVNTPTSYVGEVQPTGTKVVKSSVDNQWQPSH